MTLLERIAAAHDEVAGNPSLDEDATVHAAVVAWLEDQKGEQSTAHEAGVVQDLVQEAQR